MLLICITSSLLVVDGHQWNDPPKEFIDEHPEYRNKLILVGTSDELEEAKGTGYTFFLSFTRSPIFIDFIKYFRNV